MTVNGLSQEELKRIVHYDETIGDITWRERTGRRCVIGEKCGYIDNSSGYRRIVIRGKLYYAHRLAWLYVHGIWPPSETDHINMIRTDNRICNLRLATQSQNMQNRGLRTDSKTGFKGVHKERNGRYNAHIRINGKSLHLGMFDTAVNAAAAYEKAANDHFGEFARAV